MATTPTTSRSTDSGMKEKAQELAGRAGSAAGEQTAGLKAQAAERMRSRIESRSSEAGEQLTSIVEALRKGAEHLQTQGNDKGARAAHQAADQTQRLAGYLGGANADRLLGDLERFARGKPWLAAGIGTAAGFVASRFLRASSERRYGSSHPPVDQGRPRQEPGATAAGTVPTVPAGSELERGSTRVGRP